MYMSIIEIGRGHITLQVGDKSVTVYGEMFGKSPECQIIRFMEML
jgi:hypothetical protein